MAFDLFGFQIEQVYFNVQQRVQLAKSVKIIDCVQLRHGDGAAFRDYRPKQIKAFQVSDKFIEGFFYSFEFGVSGFGLIISR